MCTFHNDQLSWPVKEGKMKQLVNFKQNTSILFAQDVVNLDLQVCTGTGNHMISPTLPNEFPISIMIGVYECEDRY